MLRFLHRRFLAALVTALIALSTAWAPLAIATTGTAEGPPPVQTAVLPRETRARRLRRSLSLRYIATRLFGSLLDARLVRGDRRRGIARRRPMRESYARGPPRERRSARPRP